MNIILLGTGGAFPDADRNGPAFLLQHKDRSFLIDCGSGVCHQLMKADVHPSLIDYIFFTHTHIDHCVEFPSLVFSSYLSGKEDGYHVFGPIGTKHFTQSIFGDTYNFAGPLIRKVKDREINILTEEVEQGIIFKENGLIVETTLVEHCKFPALSYKFTAEGKSVVFSGDTELCGNIINLAKNVDIFLIECTYPEDGGTKPCHLIPSQVAEIAEKSSVKELVLIHLSPQCKGKEDVMVSEVKKGFSGKVEIGYDLQKISLDKKS